MASSLKVSDLLSLATPTSEDLFLIADIETSSSKKMRFADLVSAVDSVISNSSNFAITSSLETETSLREAAVAALQQKFDDLEQLSLNAGLSTGYLHVAQFTGG